MGRLSPGGSVIAGDETADVVIVGGGVMGCSLAYQLSLRGVDVLLLERDTVGSGSTARNAGGVRQQFSAEVNVRMQMLAVRMLKNFEEEIGVPADFRQNGYLFLLTRPAEVAEFRAQMEMWHRVGLTEATWLTATEARELVPALCVDDVLGCTFCPSDGIASPDAICMGYAAAARRRGARLREGVPVTGINVRGGRVTTVITAAGEVATGAVFNCAGPWAGLVGTMAGVDIPVEPHRRHIFLTGPFSEVARTAPFTIDFSASFYFHPEGDGLLMGRGEHGDLPTFATDVDPDFAEKVMEAALHRVPSLGDASIRTSWAGLYEVTPDHQAILGPVEGVEGLWCACGFSGHGLMQAPPAAFLLAQLFQEGRSDIDISPLGHSRFGAGAMRAEQNVI